LFKRGAKWVAELSIPRRRCIFFGWLLVFIVVVIVLAVIGGLTVIRKAL